MADVYKLPEDGVSSLSDLDLEANLAAAVRSFKAVSATTTVTSSTLPNLRDLKASIAALKAEQAERLAAAEAAAAEIDQLSAEVFGEPEGETEEVEASAEAEPVAEPEVEAPKAEVAVTASVRRPTLDLSAVRARQSGQGFTRYIQPEQPEGIQIVASVDVPGFRPGQEFQLADITEGAMRRATGLKTAGGGTGMVASYTLPFASDLVVNDASSAPEGSVALERAIDQRRLNGGDLVAAGGWCAPSETRYDFFNIACESGLIDLPTFGVTRGGIEFPVSPSLADALGGGTAFAGFAATLSNTSTPFLWTEADDIAAATGSPTKPCIRVPCPDFDEERLEAYGYCLTAGNLTDDAYPEATQNTLQLLMAAHAHVINARLIALMLARSTSATSITGGAATDAAAPRIYNAVGLAATDYRARFGMCIDDVLEVVFPYWVRDVIQADLAWKAGVELGDIPLEEVNRYFTARNIAVQWVNDWQVRGASQFGNATKMTAWPTTADFLIYAAGTFVHGQGMTLDLGVIRDSVLNETNDHTAAWSEEAHLIAKVGHESRRYTVGFNVNGSTSALLSGTVRV